MSNIYKEWLENVTLKEREELLSIKDNADEIVERFDRAMAFGTAGMRATVGMGTFKMNTYTVKRATMGVAQFVVKNGKEAQERGVVISYDTRRMSVEFAISAAEVLTALKVKTYLFENVRPVPICSFAVREVNAFAGIMITASHNPKEYNGYKVYGEDGAQMAIESTQAVVNFIENIDNYFTIPSVKINLEKPLCEYDGQELNNYVTVIGKDIDEKYYDAIEKLCLSKDAVKKVGKDIKLVYTPIHGAGYIPVTTILKKIGVNATVVKEQALPDTEFSTVSVPNPENKDTLSMGIKLGNEIGATVIIGTDPDCDRMGVAVKNNQGEFETLNGNQIGVLLLDYILNRKQANNTLPKNGAIVKTIVTTELARAIGESFGMTVYDVLTGFKFIGEKIKEWEKTNQHSFVFGYEESFGYLCGTHSRDKDAVVASMLFSEMVCYYQTEGKTVYERLNEIYEKYGYFSELVTNITYKGVKAMDDMAKVMEKMRNVVVKTVGNFDVQRRDDYLSGKSLSKEGKECIINLPQSDAIYYALEKNQFICIRPSGTEPKLKIYVLVNDTTKEKSIQKATFIMEEYKKLLN